MYILLKTPLWHLFTFVRFLCPLSQPVIDCFLFSCHSGYPPPPAFLIASSPATNSLFSCFAESTSGSTWGETLKAFIFSLNNSGGFPPFKCFAKNTSKAIYRNSSYGPSFGEYPGLRITCSNQNTSANAQASISKPYCAPSEVDNNKEILAGTSESLFPDSYEVFYLA